MYLLPVAFPLAKKLVLVVIVKQNYLIGIDIGSSYTKVSAYDTAGNMIGAAKRDTHPSQPAPGVAEYDAELILKAVYDCISQIITETGISPSEIAALCLDGMQSGMVGLDKDCQPTMPYSNTLDLRYFPYLDSILENHMPSILEKTGAGQPTLAAKINWLQKEFLEIYQRSEKFVTISGYLLAQLAGLSIGDVFIDVTYLWATGLSDTQQYRWSEGLCQVMGIPSEKLPRIVMPTDIVGKVTAEAAALCGIMPGTPIVAGMSDQVAGFIGAGLTSPGRMVDNAGTYPVISFCTDSFIPDILNNVAVVLPSVVEGFWNPTAYISGGGLTHHWFADTFAHADAVSAQANGQNIYHVLDGKAGKLPPGSEKLFFIPHLGGRACPQNLSYRGSWFGFTWSHDREHFYRAILESIAYDQYLMYQAMLESYPDTKVEEVVAYGGGSQSSLWNQIKADVMGLPYVCLARDDISALGNVITAGFALGIFDDLTKTSEHFIQRAARYEPDPAAHQQYRQYVEYYRSLLEQSEPAFADLAALS